MVASLLFGVSADATTGLVSPQGITIQGTILTPASQPEEAASVTFTLQVFSPGAESCLLYQESQTISMTNSNGAFSLILGNGTRSGVGFQATSTLSQIFNNASGMLSSLTCTNGSSYSPNSGDSRKVVVTFDDGTGAQTLSPSLAIQAAPFAMYADTVQGKVPTDFIEVNTGTAAVSQANVESVFASTGNVTQLLALINGTSSTYATRSGANDFSGAVSFDSPPTSATTPTTANQVANKKYCDSNIAGEAADSTLASLSNTDSGKLLEWNGTKWVAQALSVSGSNITTGQIAGNTSIATTGNIQTTGYIGGTYLYVNDHSGAGPNSVTLQAPAVVGTSYSLKLPTSVASSSGQVLTSDTSGNLSWTTPSTTATAYSGVLHVANGGTNSSTALNNNRIMVSSGGAIVESSALTNGQILIGSSGAAPVAASLTAGSGITITPGAGTISIAATGGGMSSLADDKIWVGQSGTATPVSVSGDATMTNAGAVTVSKLQGTSVSSTTPTTAGQVLRFNGGSWTPNFVAMTDLRSSITGASAFPSSCGANQTLNYNSVGDTMSCQTISVAPSSFTSQTANTFLAAPDGSSGTPSFRAIASTDLPAQPYVVGGTFNGTFGNSQILTEHPFPINVTIPAGCTKSRFEFATSATGSTIISLMKCTGSGFTSCTQFGTATISASGTVASFTCASATSFVGGTDSLVISGPSTADATAATAGWAIYGTR
jgi:hypothetical protein